MSKARVSIASRRNRLTLEELAETATPLGGATLGWQTVTTLWGAIEMTGGRETEEGGQAIGPRTGRVTLPFREGIDARNRFRFGTRILEITAVFDPDGNRRQIVCLVREVTP
jgi:SPP1 family predicted phage head-tail adaptor